MLVLHEHKEAVRCVDYCPNRPLLASGSQDGTVKLWDLARQLPHTFKGESSIEALAFSPDGSMLVSADAQGAIVGRDPTKTRGHLFSHKTTEGNSVRSLAFATEGDTIAVATWNGTLEAWKTSTRHHELRWGDQDGRATCLAFPPVGNTLFAGSDRGLIREIGLGHARERRRFQVAGQVTALRIARDGRLLAAGTGSGAIHLFDLAASKPVAALTGHTWVVYALAFTPDGRTLLSGSADGSVRLWDTAGFERVAYAWGHSWVNAVAVSPDGMTACAACADGAIVLFDLD